MKQGLLIAAAFVSLSLAAETDILKPGIDTVAGSLVTIASPEESFPLQTWSTTDPTIRSARLGIRTRQRVLAAKMSLHFLGAGALLIGVKEALYHPFTQASWFATDGVISPADLGAIMAHAKHNLFYESQNLSLGNLAVQLGVTGTVGWALREMASRLPLAFIGWISKVDEAKKEIKTMLPEGAIREAWTRIRESRVSFPPHPTLVIEVEAKGVTHFFMQVEVKEPGLFGEIDTTRSAGFVKRSLVNPDAAFERRRAIPYGILDWSTEPAKPLTKFAEDLSPQELVTQSLLDSDFRRGLAVQLVRLDPETAPVDFLRELILDDKWASEIFRSARLAAAQILLSPSFNQRPDTVDLLSALLLDPSVDVRKFAAASIARTPGVEKEPGLLQAMHEAAAHDADAPHKPKKCRDFFRKAIGL